MASNHTTTATAGYTAAVTTTINIIDANIIMLMGILFLCWHSIGTEHVMTIGTERMKI